MTAPTGGGGGQNINLAALWIPVLPDTSKMGEEMHKAGAEAKSKFEQGFNAGGSSPEQLGQGYVSKIRESMQRGFADLEIPFGVSKTSEWLNKFSGEVDEKLVNKLKGQATEALRAYSAEHDKLAEAQARVTESEQKLNSARDAGINKASVMLPLIQQQGAAHSALEQQMTTTTAAHERLSAATGRLNEEQGKAGTNSQFLAGVMGGLVVVGAGLALKAVEAFVDVIKEGFEEGIDLVKEFGEHIIEIGESYEKVEIQIQEFSGASGEALEEMNSHAQSVFGQLDVAGADTGRTMAQFAAILDAEPSAALDTLTKHVTELQGRFTGLRAQNLASIFFAFKTPIEETDAALGSLLASSRNAGQDFGTFIQSMSGTAALTLKEAGLNIEQTGHFMGELLKMGEPGNRVMTGMASAMKEFGKEGLSFGDGMKLAGEKLKELGDSAAGQDMAEKLFGTRNWIAAKTAVADYIETVEQGPDAFNANAESVDEFLDHTQTLENQWEEVKHKIEDAFKPLGAGSIELISGVIDTIKTKIDANLPQIKSRIKGLGDAFIENLPSVQSFAVGAIEMLGPLADFVKMFGVMFGQFFAGAGEIYAFITGDEDLKKKMEGFTDTLEKVRDIDFSKMASEVASQVGSVKVDVGGMKEDYDKLWDSARGEGEDQHSPGAELPEMTPHGVVGGADTWRPGSALVPSDGSRGIPVMPGVNTSTPSDGSRDGGSGNAPGIYQDSAGKWHAHDPWWEGVIQAESGGNIAPTGNSTHFGLFQFAQSTWDSVARQVNPDWVGKNPGTAPADVQAQMAQQNYEQNKNNLPGQWANDYVRQHPNGTGGSLVSAPSMFPTTGNGNGPGDNFDPNAGGTGLNLSTVAVAAQKYANDCIDASARIILSHSGVNMSEDDLKSVITPGTNIDALSAGLNKLDPQGAFRAMPGSGGSPEAMQAAIKNSIDNGTGSILNVAPGSSLAGHTFAPGHFIAATGYNPDGSINVSDTAGGKQYSVSAADAYQATQGRGIVAGTGVGPSPTAGAASPLAYGTPNNGGVSPNGYAGLPGQYGGGGVYGGETEDQRVAAAKAVREAQQRAEDMDHDIAKQQQHLQDIKDELAKGDPKAGQTGMLGGTIAETPEEQAAWAAKQKSLNDQLSDATYALGKSQRERADQDGEISTAERKQQESQFKKPSGSKQSAEGKAGETLGQGLLAGIGQELGLGDVLGKSPMDWGIVKLFTGLLNYGNSLGDAVFGKSDSGGGLFAGATPGGSQGLGGGVAQGLLGSFGINPTNVNGSVSAGPNVIAPPVPPGSDHLGPGGAGLPGPGVVNQDNSIHVSSDVSDRAVMAPVQAQQNSSNSQAFQYSGGVPAQ